jgi:PAS domain S-box-containing protein
VGPVTAHDAAASARLLALLDALFAEAPVGLAFFDLELRYVRVNERLAEINGVPAADHIGRTVDDVLPEMDARVTEGFRRVLETSEPIVDVEVVGATPREPGLTRRWLASYYPLDGPDGERIGLGADARRHDPARRRGAARLVVAGRDNRSCAGAAHLGVAGRGSGSGARAATLGGRCRPRW